MTTTSFELVPISGNPTKTANDASLQLSPITIKEDYRKEWNIHEHDFVCLTKNGELISNSLYRVGGFAANLKDDYFMLLKHVEAFYPEDILKACKNKDPKHLEGRWCILDKNGVEKVEFDHFKNPYLHGGVIYSIDNKYYNIETGDFYGDSYHSISSDNYLFLDDNYNKDKSKCGVKKINKKDGSWELFT